MNLKLVKTANVNACRYKKWGGKDTKTITLFLDIC